MTRFFRSGIYEYDKRKPRNLKTCKLCGCQIAAKGGKMYCAPCGSKRLTENIAANSRRYAKRKRDGTLPQSVPRV